MTTNTVRGLVPVKPAASLHLGWTPAGKLYAMPSGAAGQKESRDDPTQRQGIQMFTDRSARSSDRAQARQSLFRPRGLLFTVPVKENGRNMKHPLCSGRRCGSQSQIVELCPL